MYLKKFDLSGRRAVVTGGTQGIGFEISHALSEAGAEVTALTDSAEQIELAKEKMARLGYKLSAMQIDVTDSAAVTEAAGKIEADAGPVDILMNNAGIAPDFVGAEDVPDNLYLKVMDVNLNGVFWCSRAFGKYMLERGRGAIVNTGSTSGIINDVPQKQSYYNISKAGVHHLTKCLAAEWAPHGVRVNCVAPTFIETEMTKFGMEENPEITKKWLEMTPMERVGQPHEIASVALFLASDASSLMTGAIVMADAGYTLW